MKKAFYVLLIFLLSIQFATLARAAEFILVSENKVADIQGLFTVSLMLDTEGEIINTIKGELIYDENNLEVDRIHTGNSFLSFWVQKPEAVTPGSINFSGIVPGGINTNIGEVFSVVFRANKAGQAAVSVGNLNAYLNDGVGTMAKTTGSNLSLRINNSISDDPLQAFIDNEPPEKFEIIRSKDSALYDGKWFLAFNAIDKGGGVSRYRVCEFWSCDSGMSPIVLKNQSLFYFVSVEAYDENNNKTVSRLVSPYLQILILLILLPVIYFFARRFILPKI